MNHLVFLAQMLCEKQTKNPAFSVRSMARSLDVSAATLSQVMSGKRPLSKKLAEKLTQSYGLNPTESQALMECTQKSASDHESYRAMDIDSFYALSDWYSWAMLSLAKMCNQSASERWLGQKLGVLPKLVGEARDRLVRLGLLGVEKGKLVRLTGKLTVDNSQSTVAIRKFHGQMLELAQEALAMTPKDKRDISCVTFAFKISEY